MDKKSLLWYFSEMKDPRVERTRYQLLNDFISIASVPSGAESWNKMERFGVLKREWLQHSYNYPVGFHKIIRQSIE
jgi:hypothetical protein